MANRWSSTGLPQTAPLGAARSGERRPPVDVEVVAGYSAVVQQEFGGPDDVGDGGELASRCGRGELLAKGRFVGPKRAVTDDARMQSVDADGCQLGGKGVHESDDSPVYRRHDGGARVRLILCPPAEKH